MNNQQKHAINHNSQTQNATWSCDDSFFGEIESFELKLILCLIKKVIKRIVIYLIIKNQNKKEGMTQKTSKIPGLKLKRGGLDKKFKYKKA